MKIAITADIHLTTQKEHPERYHALENILEQMLTAGVNKLIIAGDLFDVSSRNYSEFDKFCQAPKHKDINFLILPGNHDVRLNIDALTAENIEIVAAPTIRTFNTGGLKFFFLPYMPDKTMGEFIADKTAELSANDWVLVGHGDWAEGLSEPNPFEPGVYMPLTRIDIDNYKPVTVVLGHIHKALDRPRIHYSGSPCGLDITETGRRRFLIMDADTGAIKPQTVDSDYIYFNEKLISLPIRDEEKYIKYKIAEIIKQWNLQKDEIARVRVQVKAHGYTLNKRALHKTIEECFQGFTFYKDRGPDLSNVSVADDINRAEIAKQVSAWIENLHWDSDLEQPDKDQILLSALHLIYEN